MAPPVAAGADARGAVWVHRHVHKTGGTSLRRVFAQLAQLHVARLPGGWRCTANVTTSPAVPSLFEMHERCERFNADVLPVVHALRAQKPVVLLTTFVRDPFEHSLSAWLWAGKPSFGRFNRTIAYWLPWNMQSNQLLRGDFDRYFMGNKEPKGSAYRDFDEGMFGELVRLLDAHYDVVCPTDLMEQCTQRVLQRLSLPRLAIPHAAPRHGQSTGRPVDHAAAVAVECRGIDCRRLVATRTVYDQRLFAYAQRSVRGWEVGRATV